jgi:hypothetical protein
MIGKNNGGATAVFPRAGRFSSNHWKRGLDNFLGLEFPFAVLDQEHNAREIPYTNRFWLVSVCSLGSSIALAMFLVETDTGLFLYQDSQPEERLVRQQGESLMLIQDHTNGALDCTLFSDDLILLVQALNSYGEDCHPEIKKAGKVDRLEGMRTAFELAAHTCALVNDTSATPAQVRKCNADVRRAFGFYTINEKEAA